MIQYNCNKCGCEMSETTFENSNTATVSFNGPVYSGEDNSDVHLCYSCTRKFRKWVKGEWDTDDSPTEFAF